ncbi:TPA: hypothetical protein TVQ98_001911 [Streptococcus equi subsp. zooepidemicus]|nr:hypothetical protein [Streptococcus equi]MCD3383588.1 hypothetical protein [Streptococcus equi subsp. zooepidemicus]HEK9993563.1 hypothetical protein [Streptococcus equi subsp. zooepidemicus]HEL0000844.1 hypothetical protein [Streptococcus equi subsp. zooepidemicus]HEL0711348.1 hypothetical protein [Streptococcus equi subsp. zooepidemicus]HEL0713332.1 hypothetical protein [Streptococcus equi subsp. zooepidemicus]
MKEFEITLKLKNEVVDSYIIDAEDVKDAIKIASDLENVKYDEILASKA